jgi:hypothetical protein
MVADVPGDLSPMREESDVSGSLEDLVPGSGDPRGERTLAIRGDHHVARTGHDEGRHFDLPEAVGNVK